MAYEDNVLIKLRRDYKENEVIMHVLNKIKELQVENGKLNAYIEELKDNPLNLYLKDRNDILFNENNRLRLENRKLTEGVKKNTNK